MKVVSLHHNQQYLQSLLSSSFVENTFVVVASHIKLISFIKELLIWPARDDGSESLKLEFCTSLKLFTFKLSGSNYFLQIVPVEIFYDN